MMKIKSLLAKEILFKFEKKYHIKVFKASAKENINVTDSFVHLTKLMIEVSDAMNSEFKMASEEPSKAQRPGSSFHLKRPSNQNSQEEVLYEEQNPC